MNWINCIIKHWTGKSMPFWKQVKKNGRHWYEHVLWQNWLPKKCQNYKCTSVFSFCLFASVCQLYKHVKDRIEIKGPNCGTLWSLFLMFFPMVTFCSRKFTHALWSHPNRKKVARKVLASDARKYNITMNVTDVLQCDFIYINITQQNITQHCTASKSNYLLPHTSRLWISALAFQVLLLGLCIMHLVVKVMN